MKRQAEEFYLPAAMQAGMPKDQYHLERPVLWGLLIYALFLASLAAVSGALDGVLKPVFQMVGVLP